MTDGTVCGVKLSAFLPPSTLEGDHRQKGEFLASGAPAPETAQLGSALRERCQGCWGRRRRTRRRGFIVGADSDARGFVDDRCVKEDRFVLGLPLTTLVARFIDSPDEIY